MHNLTPSVKGFQHLMPVQAGGVSMPVPFSNVVVKKWHAEGSWPCFKKDHKV